jgi:hypothetical protein
MSVKTHRTVSTSPSWIMPSRAWMSTFPAKALPPCGERAAADHVQA